MLGNGDLSWITNYIWSIADDVLRDLYVRGKYRDVILPMTVLRRLDAVLEDSKQAVLGMKTTLDAAGIVEQDSALRQAAGQAFYNTSKFTLRDLRARANRQQLTADFEAYLDGFSSNVQDILDNFEFRNQIPRLSRADALGTLAPFGPCRSRKAQGDCFGVRQLAAVVGGVVALIPVPPLAASNRSARYARIPPTKGQADQCPVRRRRLHAPLRQVRTDYRAVMRPRWQIPRSNARHRPGRPAPVGCSTRSPRAAIRPCRSPGLPTGCALAGFPGLPRRP